MRIIKILDRTDIRGVRKGSQISPFTHLGKSGFYFRLLRQLQNTVQANSIEDLLRTQADDESFLRFDERAHDRTVQRRLFRMGICKDGYHQEFLFPVNDHGEFRVNASGPAFSESGQEFPLIDRASDRTVKYRITASRSAAGNVSVHIDSCFDTNRQGKALYPGNYLSRELRIDAVF